jgi:hypothetical protein
MSGIYLPLLALLLPTVDAFFWSSRKNVFNSEAALTVAPGSFVPSCYGRPCEAVTVPEDPRTQRVIVLLERCAPPPPVRA